MLLSSQKKSKWEIEILRKVISVSSKKMLKPLNIYHASSYLDSIIYSNDPLNKEFIVENRFWEYVE